MIVRLRLRSHGAWEGDRVPFKFTGTIARVTIERQDVKAVEHDESKKARAVARIKKALAD